ncbi:MAG: hypothetical protein JWN77_624 [Frankiales bacterium]|nr:hypothetical protein [Frankiales bacterium]
MEVDGREVCRTTRALRVLETSHPPSWYLPGEGWADDVLSAAPGSSWCEFKGTASYVSVLDRVGAGWAYEHPTPGYELLRGAVAVYPDRMARCTVDGEPVRPQEGGFYGGWITSDVTGPFKGAPGTRGW